MVTSNIRDVLIVRRELRPFIATTSSVGKYCEAPTVQGYLTFITIFMNSNVLWGDGKAT
jgi:hypothetical protein